MERGLQAATTEVRRRLRITRLDGYVLCNERSWRQDKGLMLMPLAHVKAASSLTVFSEDVDIKHLDGFCSAMYDGPKRALLKEWLLDLARILLDPCDRLTARHSLGLHSGVLTSSDTPQPHRYAVEFGSQERRFAYFRATLCRLKIWKEDGAGLLKELKQLVQVFMADVGSWCTSRFRELASEPALNKYVILAALRDGSWLCTRLEPHGPDLVAYYAPVPTLFGRSPSAVYPAAVRVSVDQEEDQEGAWRGVSLRDHGCSASKREPSPWAGQIATRSPSPLRLPTPPRSPTLRAEARQPSPSPLPLSPTSRPHSRQASPTPGSAARQPSPTPSRGLEPPASQPLTAAALRRRSADLSTSEMAPASMADESGLQTTTSVETISLLTPTATTTSAVDTDSRAASAIRAPAPQVTVASVVFMAPLQRLASEPSSRRMLLPPPPLPLPPKPSASHGALNGASDMAPQDLRCRQDHHEVGAIRVTVTERNEAELQSPTLSIQPGVACEEVFIAQLHLRARLLNDEFQRRLLDIVGRHAAPLNGQDAGVLNLNIAGPSSCGFVGGLDDGSREGVFSRATSLGELASSREFECDMQSGETALLRVLTASPKDLPRMREKLRKYLPPHPRGQWPLSANILDPVRASIVVEGGAAQMLQVLQWFTRGDDDTGMPVRRVKNKFSRKEENVADGYRDVQLGVLFTGSRGHRIIAEIQIHDSRLYAFKLKMHKLYKIQRTSELSSI